MMVDFPLDKLEVIHNAIVSELLNVEGIDIKEVDMKIFNQSLLGLLTNDSIDLFHTHHIVTNLAEDETTLTFFVAQSVDETFEWDLMYKGYYVFIINNHSKKTDDILDFNIKDIGVFLLEVVNENSDKGIVIDDEKIKEFINSQYEFYSSSRRFAGIEAFSQYW